MHLTQAYVGLQPSTTLFLKFLETYFLLKVILVGTLLSAHLERCYINALLHYITSPTIIITQMFQIFEEMVGHTTVHVLPRTFRHRHCAGALTVASGFQNFLQQSQCHIGKS